MLFKLSLKNIKKSVKDYSIYFFTLVFAVAMFYMFNSIDAQASMLVLNNSKYEIIKSLVMLISYVSIFVSVILGFLIVYSNNFLIKRRKKEIGMYYILGMSKRKVSIILFLETLFIGIISLVVGLLAGIFLSQFLSIGVSKLFEVNMTSFKFIFSSLAFKKTILYFGVIFILVIIFNVITLNRYKLIDLINADKKNEKVKVKSKFLTILFFALALGFLGYAYYLLIFDNVLAMFDSRLWIMIACGSIGTFLLFFSLSGFLLKIFESSKKIYYKKLNLFTLKQVNNKINTTVITTTIICLMLLLTIGMLSGSMSLAKVFNGDFADNNLTDYTIIVNGYWGEVVDNDGSIEMQKVKLEELLKFETILEDKDFQKYTNDYVFFHMYNDDNLETGNLMTEKAISKLKKEYGTNISLNYNVPIIRESEYNKYAKMIGQKEIDLKEDEYILSSNIEFAIDSYKDFYSSKSSITINNHKLVPATDKILEIAFQNNTSASNDGIIIVKDSIVSELEINNASLVGNYNKNDDVEKFNDEFVKYVELNKKGNVSFDIRTRIAMEASSLGLKTMVIFLGLYLGITFAISSATVLAIGQLSESSDNRKRYRILRQLGADNKMIDNALLTQIAITFAFPLVVALIHAYFGLKEVNSLLISIGSVDLTSNIIITTLFMVVVYGGYFLITYLCSKNIIKENY